MIHSENLFKNLEFQGTWRSYQKRILDDLEQHLLDDKLHIVAAPGAGKTILGLEILRRLGKPCLILAPTITIKNQWALRLKQSFMQDKTIADKMISLNILEPKFITISTYQGLLAGLCGLKENSNQEIDDSEENEISEQEETSTKKPLSRFNKEKAVALVKILQKADIQILCFDEAHHLRNEWWKALNYIMEELNPKQTLSLTATPPYDVEYSEWKRYEELCGPVDASISIPELVKNGDLCPHQDLLYFSPLRNTEAESYEKYQKDTKNFISDFLSDSKFVHEVYQLEIWSKPNDYMELFFDDPDFYIACASLFKFDNLQVPTEFLKLFDTTQEALPDLSSDQVNILLNGFLFKYRENYPTLEPLCQKFQAQAREAGLIHKQSIIIDENPRIAKIMAHSLGKLDAIDNIVKTEIKSLKNKLRMVILADYIRYDYLKSDKETLGVIPIFKRLVKLKLNGISLCVLTGKIILIPRSVKSQLLSLMVQAKLSQENVSFVSFNYNSDYLEIRAKEKAKSKIVFLITELFNQGHLHIMVGTQALLGEGWDAPSINSLILSSSVASYMLSNQMRGRAIRIDKTNPEKVSHIWHLANVKTSTTWNMLNNKTPFVTGDLTQLKRRFQGYQAPQFRAPYNIQNGIERCYFNPDQDVVSKMDFDKITDKSLHYTREETKRAWKEGLVLGNGKDAPHLKQSINSDQPKKMRFIDQYMTKLMIASYLAIQFSYTAIRAQLFILLLPIWAIWAAFMTPSTLRIIRSGKPEGYLEQISLVILQTMYDANIIHTNPKHIQVQVKKNKSKINYSVSVENMDQREQNIFLQALREFLSPIENPRYILVRKNIFASLFKQVDYHAIPSLLAVNKKTVMIFRNYWKKRIGSCNIIYTRNIAGHKLLLKARMKAYSSMNKPPKEITSWG